MEDITFLYKYFPRKSFEESVWGYVNHHLDCLEKCKESGLFESAFFHLHILYMSFLYMQVVRLIDHAPKEMALSLILLEADKEDRIMKQWQSAKSPWVFSGRALSERKIPRFFKIVGLSKEDIEIIQGPISARNKVMHANGQYACKDEGDFEKHCSMYLKAMELLLEKQKDVLAQRYQISVAEFKEDDAYTIGENEIEEYLSLFSEREQEICSQQFSDRISEYLKKKFKED